ncbi:MAG: hypothetical protein WCI04_05050 [archaeon]
MNEVKNKFGRRGFAGVLLLFSVMIVAGILLTTNMQTKQNYSFKEIIPEMKSEITSFSLTLAEMTQNCDFASGAETCIDQNANVLMAKMPIRNINNPIYCINTSPSRISTTNTYKLSINCKAQSNICQISIIIDLNKEIILPLS